MSKRFEPKIVFFFLSVLPIYFGCSIAHIRLLQVNIYRQDTFLCADPESFVRGNPTLFFFYLMRGGRIQIPLLAGHQRPASETPFKWRFAGGPTMAQHGMLAW